MSNAAVLEVH